MKKNRRGWQMRGGVLQLWGVIVIGFLHVAATADQPPPSAPPALEITFEQNLLSVKIIQQPLFEVLVALEKTMPLQVYYRGSQADVLRAKKISATFEKLPVHEALQRLLEGQDYALRSADVKGASAGEGQGLKLWLLSGKGQLNTLQGTAMQRTAPTPNASDSTFIDADEARVRGMSIPDLIETALTHSDENMRMHATDELINKEDYTQNPQIVEALWQILRRDPEADIRRTAVEGLAGIEGLPFAALADIYHTDTNEHVRAAALRGLAELYGEKARELIAQATQDPKYFVRRMAAALTRELGEPQQAESTPNPPTSPAPSR